MYSVTEFEERDCRVSIDVVNVITHFLEHILDHNCEFFVAEDVQHVSFAVLHLFAQNADERLAITCASRIFANVKKALMYMNNDSLPLLLHHVRNPDTNNDLFIHFAENQFSTSKIIAGFESVIQRVKSRISRLCFFRNLYLVHQSCSRLVRNTIDNCNEY